MPEDPRSATTARPMAIVIFTHIMGTAVIRALGRMGVPVVALHYAPNEMGYCSRYVKQAIEVPDVRVNEAAFLNRLMELGDRLSGSLLIPTDDYTLATLSMNRRRLSTKYIVAAEDWEIVSQCIKKQHTYVRARSLGIPCPATFLIQSCADLEDHEPCIGYPCLLKPCQGHKFYDVFKLKMFKIASRGELFRQYAKVRALGLQVMLQEIIPGGDGEGVNYNSYFIDGEPIAEFTAKKVRLEPPFFGSPRVIVSKRVPEVIEPGRRLLRGLRYSGFSCMEFKKDVRDGVYKLMEINCRPNRSGSLAVKCGINFPWLTYKHLVLGEAEPCHGFREDVAWIDGTSDLMRFFVSRNEEGYSLRQYLEPYFREKVFSTLSLSDPLPFVQRIKYMLCTAAKGVQGRLLRRRQVALPSSS